MTCYTKLDFGGYCKDGIGYMCNSGICDKSTDKCINCEVNDQCAEGQICRAGECHHLKVDVGEKCSRNDNCKSDNCTDFYCWGEKQTGDPCFSDFECISGDKCEQQYCGGPQHVT